jgi:cysteinyl-tRNA synthetase
MAREKMSKSAGNIFQLSEALDRFGRDAVVAYLVSGHYRQPLEFSEATLEEAQARVERVRNFVLGLPPDSDDGDDAFVAARRESLIEALAEDFNTPRALASLFELIAEGNRRTLPGARAALEEMLPLLGLEPLLHPAEAADEQAEVLMEARERARAGRDFERADRLRDQLAAQGYEVRDTPEGPRLVRRAG